MCVCLCDREKESEITSKLNIFFRQLINYEVYLYRHNLGNKFIWACTVTMALCPCVCVHIVMAVGI